MQLSLNLFEGELSQGAVVLPHGTVQGTLSEDWVAPSLPLRQAILDFEKTIAQHPQGRASESEASLVAPVVHYFAPGVYVREMRLPKGHIVVGKLHKHTHLNVITKGKVRVITEEGLEELCAPFVWTAKAGTKRVLLALEDLVWLNVMPTETMDLAEIEESAIAQSYSDLLRIEE